jgi:competence protein ComEA
VPSADADPADRLTSIGLPPRAAGWVPDQPPGLKPEPEATDPAPFETVPAPPSRLDDLRLALAARLPEPLALRVQQASTRAVLTTLAVLVVAVVVIAMKLHGHSSGGYDGYAAPSYDDSAGNAAPADPAADGSSIVVDVKGRVRHPGLVTLPIGARVDDAIRAAGGPVHRRVLRRVDLAARVADGQLLRVGGHAKDGGAGGDGGSAPVSLSTASLEQLDTLPGVGPVTAQRIIDWRTSHGGFRSVSQLQQVSGIGPSRYAQLSPLVTP